MNNNRTNIRVRALAGVSAAALLVAAGAVWAAPAPQTNYSLDLTGVTATVANQTQYLITAGVPQLNTGDVAGTITGSSVTNTFGNSAGFPAQASNNTFSATAISLRAIPAPGYDYIVNLGALGNTGTNDGIGILHSQLTGNAGTGTPVTVTAAIASPKFTNTINNTGSFTSGSIDTSNNAATATVTVNQISPDYEVRGTVPTGYSSAVHGSAVTGFENSTLSATNSASVAVTSAQTAFNASALSGSSAAITGASIGDAVNGTAALSVSAPQTVDGNSVQASFTVNSAHNIFLAESGDSPTFNGSVLVSTNQANVEQGGDAANAASVTGTSITISNAGSSGANVVSIAGAADVSNNTVGSSATGNSAGTAGVNGGSATVGSAIIFQTGLAIQGTGSVAGNSLSMPQSPNNTLHSTLSGDLILGNGQGNTGTELGASTSNTTVAVTGANNDLTATGTVTLNGNAIDSAATGNSSVGAIQALGGANFSATAVYGNLQANDSTSIHAAVSVGVITSSLGGGADATTNGKVTLSDNAISASATGNTAGDPSIRSIAVDASNLTSTAGLAQIDNVTQWKQGSPVQASTGGGISASNVQANWGSAPISASVANSFVAASVANNISGMTITANTNAISAAASGNVGYTSVALTGSDGTFSSGVSNAQYENNPVTASLNGVTGVFISVPGNSSGSTLTLNDNSLSATAAADSAVNSLSVSGFSTLTLGAAGDVAGGIMNTHYDVGGLQPTFTNEVIGALALNNHQTNDGNVTASISTALPGLGSAGIGGNVAGGAITVDGNTASSSAIGAQATNTLTLSPGTLTTASGNIDQIATLGSIQYQGGTASTGVAISSTVDLSTASGAFGAVIGGSVTGTPVTASDNGVSAFAAGNIGNNTLTVTGTNYAAADNATALAGIQHFGMRVQAEFALQNGQFDNSPANGDSAGSRGAVITAGNVGITLAGNPATPSITTSPLTVSGNSLDTDARNNYASNTLNLTGFSTLSTSAGVLNFQNSISTVSSSVIEGKIGINADGYNSTGSPLTVSDNSSQARAIGNTAFNTLSVGAANLGGNSGTVRATASKPQEPNFVGFNASTITADYAMGSYQGTTESTRASVSGVFQLDLGDGALSGGSATVTGNSMKALSENNNGVNTLNIAAGTTTALTGALMSEQRSISPTTSATAGYGADLSFGGVQVGSTSGAPISVSSNTLSAMATNNDVTNTLNASATSNLTGAGSMGKAVVANADPGFGGNPNVAVTADFALFNVQDVSQGTTKATANPGQWGVNVDGTTANSAITVQNNSVTAQSHVNDASNTMSLGGTNVSASGALGNWQSNANSSTATISGGSVGFTGGSSITSSPLNVSGNSFIASAGGNGSTNSLNVTATNYTAPINGGVASGGTVSGGGYQATAAYAVLNMQQNSGAVTSSVGAAGAGNGLNIGINMGGGTPSAVTSSPMTVSGNTVVASAYGSNASNTITMSAGIGTLPSASLTSSQVNSGAITSTVTGANIGINVGANTGSSGVSSNNNVGAISIGNSAGNTIGVR